MTEQPPNFARRRVRRDRHAHRAEGAGEPTRDEGAEPASPASGAADSPAAPPTSEPVSEPASEPATARTRATWPTERRRRIERPRRGRSAAGPHTVDPPAPTESKESTGPIAAVERPHDPGSQAARVPLDPGSSTGPAGTWAGREPHGERRPADAEHAATARRGTPPYRPGGSSGESAQPEHAAPHPDEPTAAMGPAAQAGAPTGGTGRPLRMPPPHGPRRDTERSERNERGLRGLVGSGPSQVGVSGALRARDAARPTAADLRAAETELVIVRRHYVPPDQLPDGGPDTAPPRSGT